MALVGGAGKALGAASLEASAALLEFAIITIYGCYPLSLIGLVRDLEAAAAAAAKGPPASSAFRRAVAAVEDTLRPQRRAKSPSRRK